MTLDTLQYVKKLVAAGVNREQAEAHAEALRGVSELASKQDLRDVASELRAEINQARNELRAEIGQVRTDMWKIALAIVLATASLTTFLQRSI
jgi:uncharacterized protein YdhG (YjbR/CyaY superfamily)